MVDYFAVLGVKRTASDREIREAYRRLAKKYHPDPNPNDPSAERRMQEINEAKTVLFDPVQREEHRSKLRMRESFSTERLEALRRNSRFQGTTTYTPPSPPRRPRSKWDKRWKKYFYATIAAIVLCTIGILTYEIAKRPKLPANPVADIIARYQPSNHLLTGSLAKPRDTLLIPQDSAPGLRRSGDIFLQAGGYLPASIYYEMYLRKAPENDTVVWNLSYAYFKLGEYARSLQVLSREMRGDSNLVTAYYKIGELFLKEGKSLDARDAFLAATNTADSMSRMGEQPPEAAREASNQLARIR